MVIRQHTSKSRGEGGYTLIELLEAIAAIALGMWLADLASSHFEGIWRTVVLWSIRTVGSGVIFLCFLFGFGYLFDYLQRRKNPKTLDGEDLQKPV